MPFAQPHFKTLVYYERVRAKNTSFEVLEVSEALVYVCLSSAAHEYVKLSRDTYDLDTFHCTSDQLVGSF